MTNAFEQTEQGRGDSEPVSTLLGTVLSFSDLACAELICSHVDLVWIDLEHSTLTVRDVRDLAIAARAASCKAFVRVPTALTQNLGALLDAGIDGVVVPKVHSPDQVRQVTTRLEYPPLGERGYAPRRATKYLPRLDRGGTVRPICVIQIEDIEGLNRIEEIVQTPGIDCVVVGCADLSIELGLDEPLGEPLVNAILKVSEAANNAGRDFGLAGIGSSVLETVPNLKLSMLVAASDAGLVSNAIRALRNDFSAYSGQAQHSDRPST